MKLILITGGSASGKTTFSNNLKKELSNLTVINLDDYYYDEKTLLTIQDTLNWDDPSAFDWKQLISDLKDLKNGLTVSKSRFIYGENIRGEDIIFSPNEYIVLEGIFSPFKEEVREMANQIIYFDAADEVRYKRRLDRDKELIPNFKEEDLIKDWTTKVIPTQEKYINNFKDYSTVIVDTNNFKIVDIEKIKNLIKSL